MRGFTLPEVAVTIAMAAVGVAVAGPIVGRVGPEAKRAVSLRNLQVIGAAGGAYRLDNDEYLPIEGMWGQRRTSPAQEFSAWCSWSAGGKNNNEWWGRSGPSRLFDVEAADRPLNAYVMPGVQFTAPPPPATLPRDHPARVTEQAPVFKDPGDFVSRQQRWPQPTPGLSCYDDVGTSYLWNSIWWGQLGLEFDEEMREGTRRMARGDGARPDRFVWLSDQHVSIIAGSSSTSLQFINGYGDVNKSVMLMIDGRAGYFTLTPGRRPESYTTPNFTLIFE